MIDTGKLMTNVCINPLPTKIRVKKKIFIISLIFVSVGLTRIVINLITKRNTNEYFKLFKPHKTTLFDLTITFFGSFFK